MQAKALVEPNISLQFQGVFWKIASCACFAGINGIVRYLTGGAGEGLETTLPVYVIIFFQNLFATLIFLPMIIKEGPVSLKTKYPMLQVVRVVISALGVGLWYLSLYYIPIAKAVALTFTGPIFTVLGASLILKERIDFTRGTAIVVCFVGAFFVMRPDKHLFGADDISYGLATLLPLAAAICFAGSKLLSRSLASRGESVEALTFYLLILMAPVTFVPAAFEWVTPAAEHIYWLVGMGALAAAAHYFLNKSLSMAEVSFVMPFGYSKILISASIGYLAFGEIPKSLTMWVGSAIIFASMLLLTLPKQRKSTIQV